MPVTPCPHAGSGPHWRYAYHHGTGHRLPQSPIVLRDLLGSVRTAITIRTAGMPPALWWLAFAMIIQSMGFSFVWPFITIYVHFDLHRSLAEAGLVLLFYAGASTLGAWLGGQLHDAIGGRVAVVVGLFAQIVIFALIATGGSFLFLTVLLTASGLFGGLNRPIMNAWAGAVWPEGGRSAFNLLYVARNFGVAIGTVMGGLVAAVSIQLAFAVAAVFTLALLAIVLWRFHGTAFEAPPRRPVKEGALPAPAGGIWPILVLSLGFAVLSIAYSQMSSIMPAFMTIEGYSLPEYSLLWTLNGVLVVAGQPLISWIVGMAPDVKRQIILGTLFMIAAFVLLALSTAYLGYVTAMALATLGEMLVYPGVPAIADELAPDGTKGRFQGTAVAFQSLGRMVGPLLGGLLAAAVVRPEYYLLMTGCFAIALLLFGLVRKRQPQALDTGAGVAG